MFEVRQKRNRMMENCHYIIGTIFEIRNNKSEDIHIL